MSRFEVSNTLIANDNGYNSPPWTKLYMDDPLCKKCGKPLTGGHIKLPESIVKIESREFFSVEGLKLESMIINDRYRLIQCEKCDSPIGFEVIDGSATK